ncbi:M56 family metallopeptidase [Flavobacterium sp. MMLR14_040]|uniref:M56 family metallopeptidase n=1 Tax=Flavobacterium sp. MMLR14_040 TaxID=3093843 RepID=UPI00298F41E0|nr:M56 family metallopeptidase [Flavobacterium sp. MMLR14_040]MDW8848855.1 M56 family metallopeptidase [Flavobacterium sp. MMLR14_040]
MEALFIFVAKSSGLLILFYLAYHFLLRKETFFNSNRWFLLIGLLTSVALPFLVYTKIVWVDPTPLPNFNYSPTYVPQSSEKESFEIDWNLVSLAIYALGFLAFMLKFALDFYSLNSVLKGKQVQQQADFKFVDVKENIAPFSYFDYIVYNSSMYSESELENILEHEKVHSDQNHTIDVLISRIFCVLFWFNPIIWLYKKAILQNLEFIADREATKKISDKKAYQYTLLKITTHESCVAITNHFYQSLIKKRIVMLNKNQSKKWNYWKYYTIIPALVAFVFLFQIKVIAQEKESKEKTEVAEKTDPVDVYKINKHTTDQDLKEMAEELKENYNADVVISNVKRNSKEELTSIRIDIKKENEETQTLQIEGDKAIKKCGIVVSIKENGSNRIGILTDDAIDKPMIIEDRKIEVREIRNQVGEVTPPTPPTPPTMPTMPVFPNGPMPTAPPMDMSKMPKAPKAPTNHNDKAAMKTFEKELAEFEKKMEAFEPDMSAYEKQVEEIMAKREAIYDKEMAKYDLAMQKFDADMEKFNQYIEKAYGPSSDEYARNMGEYEKNMGEYEKGMRVYEQHMRQQERDIRKAEKNKKS